MNARLSIVEFRGFEEAQYYQNWLHAKIASSFAAGLLSVPHTEAMSVVRHVIIVDAMVRPEG